MTATCCKCGRPDPTGGYACTVCGVDRPREHLETIAELLPVALDVAYGQTASGPAIGGGTYGPRVQLNLSAKARLDAVGNALTTWAREIADERGVSEPAGEPIPTAAAWLADHCEWMRHREDAGRFIDEIRACAAILWSVSDRRRKTGRYAGPCISETEEGVCGEDVVARPGADIGKCKKCGSEYDVDEQQEWMRTEIEGHLARPVEIAGVLLRLGFTIGYSTIAAYAAKGKIVAKGADAKGNPLYRIGDVMDARMRTEKPRRSVERSRGAANPAGG